MRLLWHQTRGNRAIRRRSVKVGKHRAGLGQGVEVRRVDLATERADVGVAHIIYRN